MRTTLPDRALRPQCLFSASTHASHLVLGDCAAPGTVHGLSNTLLIKGKSALPCVPPDFLC